MTTTTTTTMTELFTDVKQSRRVVDWCEATKTKYVYIYIKVSKNPDNTTKKIVQHCPANWTEKSFDELHGKFEYENSRGELKVYDFEQRVKNVRTFNAINIDLSSSPTMAQVCLDIDNQSKKDDWVNDLGDVWRTRSVSRKMPHLWRRKNADDTNKSCQSPLKDGVKMEDFDLCYKTLFEWRDSKFENDVGEMPFFDDWASYKPNVKKVINFKKKKKSKAVSTEGGAKTKTTFKKINLSQFDFLTEEQKDIIQNIDISYIDDYDTWRQLIWGLFNTFKSVSLCVEVSKVSEKYKDKADVEHYLSTDTKKVFSFGTACYYSKCSNEDRYFSIKEYHNRTIPFDDTSLATVYLELQSDNIILTEDDEIYFYHKPYWEHQERREMSRVRVDIVIQLRKYIDAKTNRIHTAMNETEDEDERDNLLTKYNEAKKCWSKVGEDKKILAICNRVYDALKVMSKGKQYKMDRLNPELFCFNNCAFNLSTMKKVEVNKYDYVSQTTGYDYFKPSDTLITETKEWLNGIMKDTEKKDFLLTILKNACRGIQNPYIVLFNGSGHNGKSNLLKMMSELMGDYYQKCNTDLITEKIKSGANTLLASVNYKRAVVCSEPEEGITINSGAMKDLTDGEKMSGRENYAKRDRNIYLLMFLIVECNMRPKFSGAVNEALRRRVIDLLFETSFTTDEELLSLGGNYHRGDPKYCGLEWVLSHRCAMFHLIMGAEVKMNIPVSVKERSNDYLLGSDEIYNWFKNNYEFTDEEKDYVSMKDLYREFKTGLHSELYRKMDRSEQRELTKTKFSDVLKNHIVLRKNYKDKIAINEGKSSATSVFIRCKQKAMNEGDEYEI